MGRPRKLETLTRPITGRIRHGQEYWLQQQALARFDGEMGRTLRWAVDQAETFTWILGQDDPVEALDRMLNPDKYEAPDMEEVIAEAERELEQWKREQAVNRAKRARGTKEP
jgi:hypothetical protein